MLELIIKYTPEETHSPLLFSDTDGKRWKVGEIYNGALGAKMLNEALSDFNKKQAYIAYHAAAQEAAQPAPPRYKPGDRVVALEECETGYEGELGTVNKVGPKGYWIVWDGWPHICYASNNTIAPAPQAPGETAATDDD